MNNSEKVESSTSLPSDESPATVQESGVEVVTHRHDVAPSSEEILKRVTISSRRTLSEVVQPWLPMLEDEKRKEITAKFAALDNPVTDALASFTDFVHLAKTIPDFAKNEDAYKKRMWKLLGALIDKNHLTLSGALGKNSLPAGGMTDAEHALLRGMIFAQSIEAMGACPDRLSNGFKRFERIISYATVKHYQTIDEHADFLKKMFIDDTKDRIAAIKAAEIRLDGYRFPNDHQFAPNDHRVKLRRNSDEQVAVRALLDQYMGLDYQMNTEPQAGAHEHFVQMCAKAAKPEKYNSRTSTKKIAEEIAKEAEEIINGLIKGESEPPALKALIESANATRVADGRTDLLTEKETSLMTLAEYAGKEHWPWRDIIEKKFPEKIESILMDIRQLQEKVAVVEKGIPPAPVNLGEELNTWIKEYGDSSDELEKMKKDLWGAERNRIQDMLKDMAQQYFDARPFMEKFARERNIQVSQCQWEPLGMNRRLSGANYFVVGSDNGKTCLRIDAASQNGIHFVMIDTKELLGQFEAKAKGNPTIKQEIVPGQTFHITGKEGRINNIEYKDMTDGSSSHAMRADGKAPTKRHR